MGPTDHEPDKNTRAAVGALRWLLPGFCFGQVIGTTLSVLIEVMPPEAAMPRHIAVYFPEPDWLVWFRPAALALFLLGGWAWGVLTVTTAKSGRPSLRAAALAIASGIGLGLLPQGLFWIFAPANWIRSIGWTHAQGLFKDTYVQVVSTQSAIFMTACLMVMWVIGAAMAWPVKWAQDRQGHKFPPP